MRNQNMSSDADREKNPLAILKTLHPWMQLENQTLLNVEVMDPDGVTLHGLRLYRLGPNFQLREIVEAKEAHFHGEGMGHAGRSQSHPV